MKVLGALLVLGALVGKHWYNVTQTGIHFFDE